MESSTKKLKQKRDYNRINPDDYQSWKQPPEIIYNPDGTVKDRRAYDRWYFQNIKKKKYKHEPYEIKYARYAKMSEDYWRGYCEENDLDPDTWEEVKKRVEHEKWLRNQRARGRRY